MYILILVLTHMFINSALESNALVYVHNYCDDAVLCCVVVRFVEIWMDHS